ncbi:DUF2345 domain-containing protein [Clostridium sp. HBUAS56010]|uniref:DUF2345 domain-containing protein n=1 Tax=Clostridium sp. HBUAS56010 TaxID=2571127 RepID=UPI001177E757|nr:DUF2345 domain-containing protein [Clostridium sp. HBUAS56010]
MGEKRIAIKPFDMISVLDYKGTQEVNEHGCVKVRGVIRAEKKDEYIKRASEETWVQVLTYDDKDEESILFYGVVTELNIQFRGEGCVMELELFSGTKLMDYKKHLRSFQREGYTYKELTEICNKNYPQSGVIVTEGKAVSLSGFMLQYEETDWDFLKRSASHLNTVLVPSCKVKGAKYFFGLPEKKVNIGFSEEDYTVRRNSGDYDRKKAGNGSLKEVSYLVESRDYCELGSQVSFCGQSLYVYKIETMWKGSELYHRYDLRTRTGMKVSRANNEEMIGLSLMGTVEKVKDERVKLSIQGDENEQSGKRWFSFSTVYSSPDGAGWYCMPEPGDRVRLYLPTSDEADAYAASGYHENQGEGIRTEPDNKIWRNKEGKEIRMTPEQILITNNSGLSVELSDQKGIRIISDSTVSIQASNGINISSSNASVELAASNSIVLKQGETVMRMADGISFEGGKINLQ